MDRATEAVDNLRWLLIPMVGTVMVIRAYLHLVNPDTDLIIAGHEVHHLFSGAVVVLLAAFTLAFGVEGARRRATVSLLGVGAGLVLDEIVFLVATDGSNRAYLTPVSVRGAIVSTAIAAVVVAGLALRARRNADR